jgi:RNA-directed DNA polymerase
MRLKQMTKPFTIPKELIMQAYKQVKVNAGCAGIDQQTIAEFEKNLRSNLYKLWNRMSSGCYFPQPVKMVKIAKKDGGERILGVPSVIDRIAETAAKLILEPELEKHFHPDSYGYRPNKSAIDAIAVTRKRCWYYDWVIEFDIKALFDTIPWDLLEKSIEHHTDNKWVKLYIKRWLQSPMKDMQGNVTEKVKGTSQGGLCKALHKPPC